MTPHQWLWVIGIFVVVLVGSCALASVRAVARELNERDRDW